MKKLLIIALTCKALFSASLFTLENLSDLRIYLVNESQFISPAQEFELKKMLSKRLEKNGFTMDNVDSSTFFTKIEAIKLAETHVINIQIGIGEEITTKRSNEIETFAFTYLANDFIDSEDPYVETLESINFLLDEFLESYHEDNE